MEQSPVVVKQADSISPFIDLNLYHCIQLFLLSYFLNLVVVVFLFLDRLCMRALKLI